MVRIADPSTEISNSHPPFVTTPGCPFGWIRFDWFVCFCSGANQQFAIEKGKFIRYLLLISDLQENLFIFYNASKLQLKHAIAFTTNSQWWLMNEAKEIILRVNRYCNKYGNHYRDHTATNGKGIMNVTCRVCIIRSGWWRRRWDDDDVLRILRMSSAVGGPSSARWSMIFKIPRGN